MRTGCGADDHIHGVYVIVAVLILDGQEIILPMLGADDLVASGGDVNFRLIKRQNIHQNDAADLAGGPDDHYLFISERAQRFLRHLDGKGRRGHRSSRQIRIGFYLFGAGHRHPEEGIQINSRGPGSSRLLVGRLHLPENLILPDDHGIQARRHLKQMLDCLFPMEKQQIISDILFFLRACALQKHVLHKIVYNAHALRLGVHIHFRPVAGGQNHTFRDLQILGHLPHHILLLFFRERKHFSYAKRRDLMADTDDLNPHFFLFPDAFAALIMVDLEVYFQTYSFAFLNSCVNVLSYSLDSSYSSPRKSPTTVRAVLVMPASFTFSAMLVRLPMTIF